VTEHQLGLAVNAREHQLRGRLVVLYQFDDAPERVVV
jgi:hypothetical protein